MEPQGTLGLEGLNVEITNPLGKRTRRKKRNKARQQAEADDDQHRLEDSSHKVGESLNVFCPPGVSSYQPLPIPPLGISEDEGLRQPRPSFDPNVYRSASDVVRYQPPQQRDHNTQPIRFQLGQGFTPINEPSAPIGLPGGQAVKAGKPHTVASSAVGVKRYNLRSKDTAQKSTLCTTAHYSRGPMDYRTKRSPPQSTPIALPHRRKASQPSPTGPITPPLHPYLPKTPLIHIPAPAPTATYLTHSQNPPTILPTPQPLLLILDLNGTLLARTTHIRYLPRPNLKAFLTYAFANHSLLIWSSAQPKNVRGVCDELFTNAQRRRLLGIWGRDTLDLTAEQYTQRVQVYKRLDRVWKDEGIQRSHPGFKKGEMWGQHNTLLIDDSDLKASAQPFNHVEVPEFVRGGSGNAEDGGKEAVLRQVVGYLEEARKWNNVSAFVRGRKFEVNKGWTWDWKAGKGNQPQHQRHEGMVVEGNDEEDDDEDGGVRL